MGHVGVEPTKTPNHLFEMGVKSPDFHVIVMVIWYVASTTVIDKAWNKGEDGWGKRQNKQRKATANGVLVNTNCGQPSVVAAGKSKTTV